MSPRSAEFFDAAKRRLGAARSALDEDPATALSAAYYAMLYAARAALSERDTYAKTHSGTWQEFRQAFVETGQFDADLVTAAQAAQPKREPGHGLKDPQTALEQADYEAWLTPVEEARDAIELAAMFVAAVQDLLA